MCQACAHSTRSAEISTRIHGVTARDVFDAPTFDRVAPALLKLLDGRVIVGHNVSFDLRFLAAELEREGYEVPEFVAIDTLQVAKSLLRRNPPQSFKLHDLTAHLGFGIVDVLRHIGLDDRPEHSALGDAAVTAYLLSHLVQLSEAAPFWQSQLDRAEAVRWPEYVPGEVDAKRRGDATRDEPTPAPKRESGAVSVGAVLQALGAEPPRVASTSDYARLLKDSLVDRILEPSEVDALVAAAQRLGLDSATLGSLHRGHFDDVVRAAWADGVVTDEERVDVVRLSQLLGIDDDTLNAALSEGSAPTSAVTTVEARSILAEPGLVIVLTGNMSVPRDLLEAEIVSLGHVLGRGVTKKTSLVIAADPYTQSGKAQKARSYGIEVLGE